MGAKKPVLTRSRRRLLIQINRAAQRATCSCRQTGSWIVKTTLGRLLLIVLVGLAPGVLLQSNNAMQARRTRQQLIEDEAVRLVRMVGAEQRRISEGAEQVLTALGSAASVLEDHPEICERLLSNLISKTQRYIAAAIIAADGHFLCLSKEYDPATDLSDRTYVRLAMQTGGFAVGDYVIDR